MEDMLPTNKENELGSKADTSEDSTRSKLVADMEKKELKNTSKTMTATIQNDSLKIWTNVELEKLRSKIGLVAGALADFQEAGGLVAVKPVETEFQGHIIITQKVMLVAEGLNLVAVETEDGIDFDLVAVEIGKVGSE